jgi:uncharacterized membrane protein YqjE
MTYSGEDAYRGEEELRERSLPELMKQLAEGTTTLVRQEIELAKVELSDKGRTAGQAAGMFGAAAAIALLAGGALTACIILLLNFVMDAWLAALIVAVVYAIVAGVLGRRGKERLDAAGPPVPQQTVETVKEDVEWAKTQTRSDER